MPPAIDEIVKRRVIQQWLSGKARDKIAADNNIGSGTVSAVVDNYTIGLDNLDFGSFRELMVEAKKQGMTPSDLASCVRLLNYFRSSGASEEEVESFIVRVSTADFSPEKIISCVNQLYEITKGQLIPLHELPNYIKQKLEEKQKIDEQIKEADAVLQTKNVKVKTINEYTKLNEKLNHHGLSTWDVNKLVKLVVNAQGFGFDAKKIVGKLSNIRRLEKKEKGLENNCVIVSKQAAKYKDIMPLTEEIVALQIGIDESIALKAGINEAAKLYNLPHFTATLRLINDIKNTIK